MPLPVNSWRVASMPALSCGPLAASVTSTPAWARANLACTILREGLVARAASIKPLSCESPNSRHHWVLMSTGPPGVTGSPSEEASRKVAWDWIPVMLVQADKPSATAMSQADCDQRVRTPGLWWSSLMGASWSRLRGCCGLGQGLGVVQNATQKTLQCFKFLHRETGEVRVLHAAQDGWNTFCRCAPCFGQLDVDDTPVRHGSHPATQALGFQPVKQAGHGASVQMAFPRQLGHGGRFAQKQLEQRHPLRIGQVTGFE